MDQLPVGNAHSPSLRMAMIKTMKGKKSNFHISAMSIKPSYRDEKDSVLILE